MALKVDGNDLYGVMIERLDRRGQPVKGSGKIHHIHAESSAQARMHYSVVYPNRRTHRIVYAAPCVGLFVNDKKGLDISAT